MDRQKYKKTYIQKFNENVAGVCFVRNFFYRECTGIGNRAFGVFAFFRSLFEKFGRAYDQMDKVFKLMHWQSTSQLSVHNVEEPKETLSCDKTKIFDNHATTYLMGIDVPVAVKNAARTRIIEPCNFCYQIK